MNRIILILFLCFPLLLSAQGQTVRLNLEEAVKYALKKNFAQQSILIDKQIEQTILEQSKLELLPDLNGNLSQDFSNSKAVNNSWGGNYALAASVPLYQGGKTMNTIKLNKLSLAQSDSNIAQAQNNLATQVIQAFLQVIMNEELYNYLLVVERTSAQQMKQGEIKYKNGQILESDYLLLKAQAATDSFNVLNTRTSRDNSILDLKTLLSVTDNVVLELVTPSQDQLVVNDVPSLNEVVARTFEWFPDLKIAGQNVQMSELNVKLSKASALPSLSLNGSIGTGYLSGGKSFGSQLGNKFSQQAGVTLSIPIWNKGRVKSQVRQSSYRLEQSKLAQSDTELQLRQQLEQEYNTVTTGYQKYITSNERAEAYRQSAAAYRKQFEHGQITVVEMLQQETNYLSALNDYIQNKYTYLLNRKLIDVYMGIEIKL